MRRERDIIIKVIQKDSIGYKRLAQYFANKHNEKISESQKEKS